MVFPSLGFLCLFLPVFLIAYFIFPKQRIITLAAFSLLFYAFGETIWIIILLLSAAVNYLLALRMANGEKKNTFYTALVFNLGLICVFKYLGFIVINLNAFLGINLPVPDIHLPIGISFYTFQALSYIIDVYRGKVEAEKSILKFLVYITMFPQLVAGPIVRYSDIIEPLTKPNINAECISAGLTRFAVGFGKKVLLADSAAKVVDNLFNVDANFTVMGCWIGLIFLVFQVYFDFSGYSDMAIGLGRIIGFEFPENFNYPITARSVTDFWRRWHMTLFSFFRDYVYIPMGGNRKKQYMNILTVWGLTGLWHGANWNFVIWGIYYGLILIIEKKLLHRVLAKLPSPLLRIYTFAFILFGWPLFYFTSGSRFFDFIKAACGIGVQAYDIRSISVFAMNIFLLPILILAATPLPRKLARLLTKKPYLALLEPLGGAAIMAASFAALIGQSYSPFLYFRF